jgi:hypothetical protein
MRKQAKEVEIGDKIIIPNMRDDADCKEVGIVHNVFTRDIRYVGLLTQFDFGPGRYSVEVPAERMVTVFESIG